MDALKIFLVEDDQWFADLVTYHLKLNPDYEIEVYAQGNELFQNLYKSPSVIILDYGLPGMNGQEILKRLKTDYPDIEVIMLSGQKDLQVAVDLLKLGAYDYIIKNDECKERIWNTLIHIREQLNLKNENAALREEIGKRFDYRQNIIGNSPALLAVFDLLERAIDSNITVSISGETGTGKELIARAIHYNSKRKSKKFIPVNVSAIPKELVESELFGHEKGAFTGAVSRRTGKFEDAHLGTIFLDEIAEMDLNMQAKILRVLQEREITRIGNNQAVNIDTRVIIATHKNLAEEVKKGNFRQDLYYRLLGLPIQLPPLRERGNDILLLANYFAEQYCKTNQIPPVDISTEAGKKLMGYAFPGNIRELQAIIDLAIILSNHNRIEPQDISFGTVEEERLISGDFTMDQFQEKILKHMLQKNNNNAVLVAKKLQLGISTVYRLMKKYNISLPSQK